jgi:hypothetical protein
MIFDHVAQQTPAIEPAVRWYREHFDDVEVLYQDDTWALLSVGSAKIALVVPDQHPPHVAWRVDQQELARLAERHGVAPVGHRDGSHSIYLNGPGAITVELVSYPGE